MKLLKASVIIMGILIVVGMTILLVTVIKRYGEGDPATAGAAGSSSSLGAGLSVPVERGFGERAVAIPKGAEPLETRLDGGRLVVRLRLADGTSALLILDAASGEKLGLIRLDPR